MTLTFQLPVPPLALRPNGRVHFMVKAKATKTARDLARREAERVLADAKSLPPKWKRATYRAVLFHPTSRVPDPDNFNASLKAYLDGFADAGIVANDRGLWPQRTEFRRTDRMPRVEISITEEK